MRVGAARYDTDAGMLELLSNQVFRSTAECVWLLDETDSTLWANSYVKKPVDYGGFLDAMKVIGFYWLTLNRNSPEVG